MRSTSYIRSAISIIDAYNGSIPFAAWLKTYFKEHKKFGSRDRKLVADLCFCYFRLGASFKEKDIDERILIAQFLCHKQSHFITELKPEWGPHQHLPVEEKIKFLSGETSSIFFPLLDEVSKDIEPKKFTESLLIQPDLFLRIRPGKEKEVVQKLEVANINFLLEGHCLRLSNSTKIDGVLLVDDEVVIQDRSSQQVLHSLAKNITANKFHSWDCCAASGGKTILLHDLYPSASLTVSDIRQSILHNLRSRFKRAGILSYQSFIADISAVQFHHTKKYDLIICDAPCSGSGTWARTPEQLHFFKKEKIGSYAALQKSIVSNAAKSLKPGGYLVYITCSVFAKENEEVVDYMQRQMPLRVLSSNYITGYQHKADTLFTALFTI